MKIGLAGISFCGEYWLSPVETEATSFFSYLGFDVETLVEVLGSKLGELVVEDVKPGLLHILPVDDKAALVGEWHPLGLGLETDAVPHWLQLTL